MKPRRRRRTKRKPRRVSEILSGSRRFFRVNSCTSFSELVDGTEKSERRTNVHGTSAAIRKFFDSYERRKKYASSLGFHRRFFSSLRQFIVFGCAARGLCVLGFLIFSFHFVGSLVSSLWRRWGKNYKTKRQRARENKTKSQYGRQRLSWKL